MTSSTETARWAWRLLTLTALALTALAVAPSALAAQREIASAGPLTRIIITDTLNCQVAHASDTQFEFFPPGSQSGDCGTFVVVGGTLYGPSLIAAGEDTSLSARTAFTPISQSGPTGSGTAADPYVITTVVALGTTGLQLTQRDSYVVGQESYRTDITITNSATGTAQSLIVYRAGDCFLQNSDAGFGRADPGGRIACLAPSDPDADPPTPGTRIEQFIPITAGSHYYEDYYDDVWERIGDRLEFPDTCECAVYQDNGAGLSWSVSLPAAGGSVTISSLITFSPLGVSPLSLTKTAASPTSPAGTANAYTVTINNPNASAVTLNSVTDVLPAGFAFIPGSATFNGVPTANPTVTGQTLTFAGPFSVPASGTATLSFGVTVSSTPGTYTNSATAEAGTVAVVPTGNTAPITVIGVVPPVFTLTLAPATATNPVGQNHTVTATLMRGTTAVGSGAILFTVSPTPAPGPATGSATTNASGQATFTFTSATAGPFTITACYDANTTGICDPGEQTATATKTFAAVAPPTDTTPPNCEVVFLGANFIRVRVQDVASGLGQGAVVPISPTANVTVNNPTANPAFQTTTGPVFVTATRINRRLPARLQIRVVDVAGNPTTCDPVLSTLRIGRSGTAASQTFTAIPRIEHKLTIKGLQPGKIRAIVTVNGQVFRLTVNGQKAKTISIARALTHGRMNKVKVKIYGKAGARALVALTD